MAPAAFFKTPPLRGHNEAILPVLKSSGHTINLISGPVVMLLLYVLQSLKRQLSGDQKNKLGLYDTIWKFLCKAEARDKTGRIAQYACRGLQGVMDHMPGSPLALWRPAVAEVQTTLAWARRTHRWGKEMPHIPKMARAIEKGDWLEAGQCAVLITFLVQDHIYFLLKVGLLKFQNYTAVQWHRRNLRFITFSHVLNFLLCARDIQRIMQKQENKDPEYCGSEKAVEKAKSEIYDSQKMMFRYVLTFIQMLHVSSVKQFDDWYVGLFGMMSSFIDASKQWPSS